VPTFGTFIRNLTPGSAAGLPGLSMPAGMTGAGLPVGIAIDGPEQSDRDVLAIAAAIETILPRLPPPVV
jgi:indoleacetamide hydrolase